MCRVRIVQFFLPQLRAARQGAAGYPIKPHEVLDDAGKVLDDIEEKFYLYEGHCVCVANQQASRRARERAPREGYLSRDPDNQLEDEVRSLFSP